MTTPTLETERLVLRPWQTADAPALFAILQEKDILRYFPRPGLPPAGWAERYIAHHQAHWEKIGYGHWAVADRLSGQVIGWHGLELLPETGETEVAYLLSHAWWGQGLATEAGRAVVQYAFEKADLASIIALVHPENRASIRVIEKLGLSFNGLKPYFGMELRHYTLARPATK